MQVQMSKKSGARLDPKRTALIAAGRDVIVSLPKQERFIALADAKAVLSNEESGAIFDPQRSYRYLLWRQWQRDSESICFIMLNPSTADAHHTDPTIARCIAFAKKWGFGGLEVVNLFAFRSTLASRLAKVRDPVGRHNDYFLRQFAAGKRMVVLAWGNHGLLKDRHSAVIEMLTKDGHASKLHHLGMTRFNQPRHPLYVKAMIEPIAFCSMPCL